jgi:D-glucosaminate-6-phosphate ammonia-lyase
MADIYGRLYLRTIINANGTSTRVSGGIMPIEAAQAMYEASQSCVDMLELQARASRIIAKITGAEAGQGLEPLDRGPAPAARSACAKRRSFAR